MPGLLSKLCSASSYILDYHASLLGITHAGHTFRTPKGHKGRFAKLRDLEQGRRDDSYHYAIADLLTQPEEDSFSLMSCALHRTRIQPLKESKGQAAPYRCASGFAVWLVLALTSACATVVGFHEDVKIPPEIHAPLQASSGWVYVGRTADAAYYVRVQDWQKPHEARARSLHLVCPRSSVCSRLLSSLQRLAE